MVPRDVIDQIRHQVDIADVIGQVVTLRQKGSSLMGLCPFHQEKTPSFSVVRSKGIYHCFGCGEAGDVFNFLMKTRGVPFMDAVRELAEVAGVILEERETSPAEKRARRARASLYDVCEAARGWFVGQLQGPSGAEARLYLKDRGLSQETIQRFDLGLAPDGWSGLLDWLHKEGFDAEQVVSAGLARWRDASDKRRGAYDAFRDRIIVPVRDDRGRVVAFGGRILSTPKDARNPPPKYVNSQETDIYKKSNVLYGLSGARAAIQRKGRALVVEGYFDVIALHQAGFDEAIATCGTALTKHHLEIIRRLTQRVVALFDADEAGVAAAIKSLPLFLEAGIEPLRLDLGEAKDPDELLQNSGTEAFEAALGAAEPLFELALRRAIKRHGITPGGREQTLAALAPILRTYSNTARPVVIGRVARALGLPDAVIAERIGSQGSRTDAPLPRPKWRGSRELNHLLWLVIHHPTEVAPILKSADPGWITDRPTVLKAMAQLMDAEPLPEVVADLGDPDLERVLLSAGARQDLYPPDRAAAAATQILGKLELVSVEAHLAELAGEISTCSPSADAPRYFALSKERQQLQQKRRVIIEGLSNR